MTVREIAAMTNIDPWFLYQLKEISDEQAGLLRIATDSLTTDKLRDLKRVGFSDARIAQALHLGNGSSLSEAAHQLRKKHGVTPVYKRVDTCAAEFESFTPYMYSTYEE